MKSKQTSVDWLVNELIKLGYLHSNDYNNSPTVNNVIKYANQIHKEQMMEAYSIGKGTINPEHIYHITYEKN